MININTILSTFDERGTLLKWLKITNNALKNASLKSVEAVQPTATTLQLKFIFADDSSLLSPPITLPKDTTLPGYIDFFSGYLIETSYDTNVFNFKAPFEMKSTETGEVLKTGDFNFNILIGGSDFIAVGLDESDTFLQIKLDETKVDTEVKEGSSNLITSGAVYDKSTIIVNVTDYIEYDSLTEEEKTAINEGLKKAFNNNQNMIIMSQNRKKYDLAIQNIDEGFATFLSLDPDDIEEGVSVTFKRNEDGTFSYLSESLEKFNLLYNYDFSFLDEDNTRIVIKYQGIAGVLSYSSPAEALEKFYSHYHNYSNGTITIGNKSHLILDLTFSDQTDYTFYYIENGEIKFYLIDSSVIKG